MLALIGAIALAGAAPPPVADIRNSLAGQWSGALGYRDYQSNELFELPVKTRIENVPDGVTQVRTSEYDEGPRQKPVWIVSVSQQQGEVVVTATARAGREVEVQKERVTVVRYATPTDWQLVYSQTGMDDDKPAEIRVTETLRGRELMAVKEVRPVGDPAQPWKFRNQTRLTRTAP